MKNRQRVKARMFGLFMLIIIFFCPEESFAKEEDAIETAKNGIVEIYSGLTDQNGTFHRIKNTSGVLISNQEDNTCIITTCHSITISKKEEKKFYFDNKIQKDSQNYSQSIRAVVKNDVLAEMAVVAKSETQDFCILQTDDILKEKSVLKLGNSSELSTGKVVYTFGFPENAIENPYAKFSAPEVEIHEGKIQDPAAKASETAYLQHSAVVMPGNSGGALIDEKGYVVGMNNAALSNANEQVYYSLPIDDIKAILNNYGIAYESKDRDTALGLLVVEYKKCAGLIKKKDYKASSLEILQQAMQSAASVIEENTYDIEKIKSAEQSLKNAEEKLVKKTTKMRMISYILAAVLAVLLVWLVQLLIWNRNHKKISQNGEMSLSADKEEPDKTDVSKKDSISYSRDVGEDKKEDERIETELPIEIEDDGKTIILSSYDNNVQKKMTRAGLVRKRDGQKSFITSTEYRIGQNPELVNLAITDNKAVSRRHAVIRWTTEGYRIYDLESANGTFVNGERLEGAGRLLADKDEIMVADERFEFIKIDTEGERRDEK